jgi:hypothetical protein
MPLTPAEFEADPLNASGGAPGLGKDKQGNVTFLRLNGGTEWSRPLRGNPHDTTFVALNLHASVTTVVQIGGAWLSVLPSERNPARVALVTGASDGKGALTWSKGIIEVNLEKFGGSEMGALPILTVRLDPATGTWDLFSGSRPVAWGLPLSRPGNGNSAANKLIIRAGAGGAWLNAVALADRHPLFEDANGNGIDDAYEIAKKGALLRPNAAASAKSLAADWLKEQSKLPVRPTPARRPMPDRLLARSGH